jgi:signal peptidase II
MPAYMNKWFGISALIIVLDQVTKYAASHMLIMHEPVAILPFFNFTLMHNTGAAFSFLADQGGWQRWFFAVLALGVSIVLAVWLTRLKAHESWLALALSLVLGGAIGNLIDRVYYGYVIDFIDVYYNTSHWPAFNIADSAICIGAVMLVIDTFRSKEKSW